MRILAAVVGCALLACACSVPEKHPALGDGGVVDAPPSDGHGAAPETMITVAPDPFSRFGSATFQFSSDVASARFECSIDDEAQVACSSPYTRTLGDGAHSFSVRAIDPSGEGDDSPAEHLWTIDTVAPQTQLTEVPPAADNSVMVRFSFTSNEANVTFDCALDGGSYVPCESGETFGPIADGSHAFAVRAHDRAGNVDASPAIHAWSVDTTTPDTQLLSGPEGATAATTASFTFGSPDAGGGATFECSLDGSTFAACTSPQGYAGLGEGPHAFAVRVRDAVGNYDPTPATRTWVVDLTPPDTAILSGPSGTVRLASATFTFASPEAGVGFACSLDGAPFAACTSPHNVTSLGQGAHAFSVRAVDLAGHADPTPATAAWTVDTIAPDVTITMGPAAGATSGPRVTFGFTASDGEVTCSLDEAGFALCTSPLAFNAPAGVHELRVRATDAAGNATTVARAWTIACAAPDAAGAAGVLHLDDSGQVLANAVAGGANATRGSDATPEVADPSSIPGRFGSALAFAAAEDDHVAWPVALGPLADLTIELWVRPDAPAGARDLVVSGDGRIAVRALAVTPSTVRITVTLVENGGAARIVTSAAVAAGAWHHVIASLADPSLRLWVDGVRTDVAVALGVGPPLEALQLGGTGATAYDGAIDEVWLAQTAITDDEVALARYCPAP